MRKVRIYLFILYCEYLVYVVLTNRTRPYQTSLYMDTLRALYYGFSTLPSAKKIDSHVRNPFITAGIYTIIYRVIGVTTELLSSWTLYVQYTRT